MDGEGYFANIGAKVLLRQDWRNDGQGPLVIPPGAVGPLLDVGELGFEIGHICSLGADEVALRVGGIERLDVDDGSFHRKNRPPGATTDLKDTSAAALDAARAMRGGVLREQFRHAGTKVDAPMLGQPFRLRLCERGVGERVLWWGLFQRGYFIRPASFLAGENIVNGNVRFDIEDGCAIHEITRAENQTTSFHAEKLHGGEAERIRPVRGARGKNTTPFRRASGRENKGLPSIVPMEPPDEPDACEAGDILQGLLVAAIRQEFEDVLLGLFFQRLMTRMKLQRFLRRDVADGFKCQAVVQSGCLSMKQLSVRPNAGTRELSKW